MPELIPTPATPTTPETPAAEAKTGHRAEEDFVSRFSAELASGAKGVERGIPRESKREGVTQSTVRITEAVDDGADGAAAATDVDDALDDATDASVAATPADTPADATEKVETQGDETAEQAKARVANEKAVAAEFDSVLTKHGLKTSIDELPEAARPLVKRRLEEQTAAFTRAMQEARSYRGEEAKFRAEQKFAAEHPDLFVMELLQKDPALLDKINARLDETTTETGKRALDVVTKDTRRDVLDAVTREATEAKERYDRRMSRADELVVYTKRVAQRLEMPENILMKAVAFELKDKPEDARDLTNDELEAVLRREFQEWRAATAKIRQKDEKEIIRARTQDRRTTSPAARGRSSGTPAGPSGTKDPQTDDEFVAHMERKIAGRR